MYDFTVDYDEESNLGEVVCKNVLFSFYFSVEEDGIHTAKFEFDESLTLDFIVHLLNRVNRRLHKLAEKTDLDEADGLANER